MNQQPEALRLADLIPHLQAMGDELRRLDAENETLRKDAERYRWLKSVKHLELNSTNGEWIREDDSRFISSHRLCAFGTAFAPYPTLDETIDAAMGVTDHETPSQ